MIKRYIAPFKWLILSACLSFTSNHHNNLSNAYANSDHYEPEHDRAVRMGNWSYRQNWRYNKDAYFRGESQSQAYRNNHPYGSRKIGYDGHKKNVKGSSGNGSNKSYQNQNGYQGTNRADDNQNNHKQPSQYSQNPGRINQNLVSDHQRANYYPQNQAIRNNYQQPTDYKYHQYRYY